MDRLVMKGRNTLASLALWSGLLFGQAVGATEPACDNEALTGFDGLLVLAPHPDDEMLGFAGLVDAFRRQGKPVRVVVVTDGDAFCGACTLWKNGALVGPGCDALELSNLATPEVDSFAEVRRSESAAAAAVLGLPAPQFLGYPDTGLAAAWAAREAGSMETPLHRSDFSACDGCEDCAGYGVGPQLELSAVRSELVEQFAPGVVRGFLIKHFPMLLNLHTGPERHQLQRPQQYLPEVSYVHRGVVCLRGHRDSHCVGRVYRPQPFYRDTVSVYSPEFVRPPAFSTTTTSGTLLVL